jgi:hypothetical protein
LIPIYRRGFTSAQTKCSFFAENIRGYLTMNIKLADPLALLFDVWLLEGWYVPSQGYVHIVVFGETSRLFRKKNSYSYFQGP